MPDEKLIADQLENINKSLILIAQMLLKLIEIQSNVYRDKDQDPDSEEKLTNA